MPATQGRDRDQWITDRITVKKRHNKNKSSLNVEGDVVIVATNSTLDNTEHKTQSGLTIEGDSNQTGNIPSAIRFVDTYNDKVKGNILFTHAKDASTNNKIQLNVYDLSQSTQNTLELNEDKTIISANTEVGSSSANKNLQIYGNTIVSGTLTPTTLTLGSYSNVEDKLDALQTSVDSKHNSITSSTNLSVNSIVAHGNQFMTLEGSTADDYEATLQINDPTKDWTLTFPTPTGTSPSCLYDESSLNADNIASGNLNEARLPVHSSLSAKLYINNTQQLITDTTKASYTGLYINGNSYFDGAVHTEQGIRLDDSGTIVPSAGNITIEPVSTEIIMKGNLRLHNDNLTAGPLLKAGDDSNITLTLPTSTGTLSLKAPVDTNTINISANTSKNVLEEIVLCPTTYDSSGDVETGSDINISTYVSRVPTGNTPTLERLTAVQTLSSNDEVDVDGTNITYYLPPSDSNHLTISYDLQFSYSNKTSSMFSAIIMASFNSGTYYPIYNSIRGVGQASAWRMETLQITATIHHNGTGTTEAYINRGLLNINSLGASDYWSFKVVGCRYHGSSDWGSIDIHEGHYFNSSMWSSSYLSGTPLLAPPHIRITATK